MTPSKLTLEGQTEEKLVSEIKVGNPTNDVQIYEIYPDDFANQIKINPASFVLEAKSNKTVAITFDSARSGTLATNISVLSKPLLDSRFSANTGVKIPITITISQSSGIFQPRHFEVAGAVLLLLIPVIYFLFLKRKKVIA